ncbi:MAG: ADP-ribosylation factor 1-like protein [Linnemannia gamsii]|nr:MAG: ADP-ribosylation factor 1-like protein [Linnemannia gamsii]
MLSSVSNFFTLKINFFSPPPHNEEEQRVIMLGLSGTGKTTILYRLLHNRAVLTDRTYGFNKETIQLSPSCKKLTICDYSGASGDIRFWHHLLNDERVPVIFVVDSTERGDLDEVKHALLVTYRSLLRESTRYGVLLVLCNKQDLPDAMSIEYIKDRLGLDEIWQWGRRWHICGVSAMTGDGLQEGLEWLETQLTGPALPSPFLRTH